MKDPNMLKWWGCIHVCDFEKRTSPKSDRNIHLITTVTSNETCLIYNACSHLLLQLKTKKKFVVKLTISPVQHQIIEMDSDLRVKRAVYRKCLRELELSIDYGWNVNRLFSKNSPEHTKEWFAPLHLAIDAGWMEGVQYLVEAGAKINLPGHIIHEGPERRTKLAFTPLMRAISHSPEENRSAIIKYLIEKGADANAMCPYTKRSPIITAVTYPNRQAVVYLLGNCSIDLDITVNTSDGPKKVLDMACKEVTDESIYTYKQLPGIPELQSFQDLINHGAEVNASPIPLRHLVSLKGFTQGVLDVLNLMYHKGLNVDAITYDPEFCRPTAFCEAIRNSGHLNYIRWLLKHGATTKMIGVQKLFTEALYFKQYPVAEILVYSGVPTHPFDQSIVKHISSIPRE